MKSVFNRGKRLQLLKSIRKASRRNGQLAFLFISNDKSSLSLFVVLLLNSIAANSYIMKRAGIFF